MSTLTKDKFLTASELEHLKHTLNACWDKDPRNATLISLSLNSGARPSEVLAIRRQDLNPETNSILFIGLKGSRSRELPVPFALFQRLEYLAKDLQPMDRIFPVALRTYQKVWDHYRPCQKKGVRSLRHTFAIQLYKKTKDIRLVQMALGHKSILNTMVYADYVYNQEELQKLLL